MDLMCDERPSDSPFVERIWRSQSESAEPFISIAENHCEIVVTRHQDKLSLTVRGPETRATPADGRGDAEIFGIQFKAGVFLPELPPRLIMDRRDPTLPEAGSKSFWLHGSAWQFPDYENVDTFIDRLVRDGLLVRDPLVEAAIQGKPAETSLRTVQRRFLQATGLTQNTFLQIERARYATTLLKKGVPIIDAVYQAGYFDQPHLTRSLKHFIGLTPAQIIDQVRPEVLSFLYKTEPVDLAMIGTSDLQGFGA